MMQQKAMVVCFFLLSAMVVCFIPKVNNYCQKLVHRYSSVSFSCFKCLLFWKKNICKVLVLKGDNLVREGCVATIFPVSLGPTVTLGQVK